MERAVIRWGIAGPGAIAARFADGMRDVVGGGVVAVGSRSVERADAFAIQRIAGHSSILISQRYVHPTPERLETAFAQLEAYNAVQQKKLEAETKVQ